MRTTFINTLTEMARIDDRIMCVIGDTGYSVFEDFEKEFGSRFVNVGIAEQNFVSFGAGLAAMGMKPYIYNVVSFMVYRAFEEIELDIAYQENPVVIVGVGGGHAYSTAGPTHHGYFDIAMMRMLPGMTVLCPADPTEMREIMLLSGEYNKPMYIRIGRSVDPVIYNSPIRLEIGKGICVKEGNDAVILATGVMVKDAIEAGNILEKKGVSIGIYSVHTIKPMDEEMIKKCLDKYKVIFTLEEHSINGGLGSAVEDVIIKFSKRSEARLYKLGFPDIFAPVTGTREYLNDLYGISPDKIAEKVKYECDK